MAGIGKAIAEFGDALSNTIRNAFNSNTVKNASKKIGKAIGHTPKFLGNTALKAGATASVVAADGVEIGKKVGKTALKFGLGTLKEGNELVHAAAGAVEMLEKAHIIESVNGNLGKSMIGYKFTAGAKLGLLPVGLLAGAIGGTKDYMTSEARQGRNDGMIRRPTPAATNPYELAQSMAYSQSGRSYADNAGADADLARAISGMR